LRRLSGDEVLRLQNLQVEPLRAPFEHAYYRIEPLIGDRGYDHDKYRRLVRERGIRPVIARCEDEPEAGRAEQSQPLPAAELRGRAPSGCRLPLWWRRPPSWSRKNARAQSLDWRSAD